jgi:ribulose-bisphosphate carboxylase large chain
VNLNIPDRVIRSFPGPAYGPAGLRRATGRTPTEPAFGTILKPTAGITPEEVEHLVMQVADCPLFMFVKEDEDLYPNLDYSPVKERARRAMQAVQAQREARGGRSLLFAPHISGAPHEIVETLQAVLEAGANAVMFSESFAGGTVRMVREATRHLERPPALYGHNAGIGVKTRGIWREVIDLLARLDGIDFRQTAPVRPGTPFLRPYGEEWAASENALSRPLPGINPTMLVRAGALDQGNLGLNMADAERRGIQENILFLAGSAINSLKNADGQVEAQIGIQSMQQAIEVFNSGVIKDVPAEEHLPALYTVAQQRGYKELVSALHQRYPDFKPFEKAPSPSGIAQQPG